MTASAQACIYNHGYASLIRYSDTIARTSSGGVCATGNARGLPHETQRVHDRRLFGLSVVLAGKVQAHHSLNTFEQAPIVLEGELVGINWRNPHVTFQLRVVDDSGEEAVWRMEAHSVFNLKRGGVTQDLIPVGEYVRVVGRRSSIADHRMIVDTMRLSDGRELTLWAGLFSTFDDEPRIQDAASENLGLFRVWTVARRMSHARSPRPTSCR